MTVVVAACAGMCGMLRDSRFCSAFLHRRGEPGKRWRMARPRMVVVVKHGEDAVLEGDDAEDLLQVRVPAVEMSGGVRALSSAYVPARAGGGAWTASRRPCRQPRG